MRVRAVIGANYGDEGKGLLTDYLCAGQPGSLVVRFNGGAQAGHTVQTPEGKRHIFNHFGSGAFVGAPTYLSRFFVCNPLVWGLEITAMRKQGISGIPKTYVHPDAPVTTPYDVLYNRARERARGADRHGSVGLGVWETVRRHQAGVQTCTRHIGTAGWKTRLSVVMEYYAALMRHEGVEDLGPLWNLEKLRVDFAEMVEWFGTSMEWAEGLEDLPIENLVFEAGQGLLLDETNKENFPYVSASRTGMHNIIELCREWSIDPAEVQPYYVTRTYLTRHGPGPLPGQCDSMKAIDDDRTNKENEWQGKLRYAPLNVDSLLFRIFGDSRKRKPSLAVTHLDQRPMPEDLDIACLGFEDVLVSRGPTRDDVRRKYDSE